MSAHTIFSIFSTNKLFFCKIYKLVFTYILSRCVCDSVVHFVDVPSLSVKLPDVDNVHLNTASNCLFLSLPVFDQLDLVTYEEVVKLPAFKRKTLVLLGEFCTV